MTKQIKKCYMCDAGGVTDEHVPPRCIFPEQKDALNGKDLRLGLIKVPSCHEHNTAKSTDDVYFQFVITANILRNAYADHQVKTKLKRAIERSPHVYNSFVENRIIVKMEDVNGLDHSNIAYEVNMGRLTSSIEHIAYGLYYYEYNETFTGEIVQSVEGTLQQEDPTLTSDISGLIANFELLLSGIPWKGGNPDVFQYKIQKVDSSTYLLMKFYDSLRITVVMK